MALKNRTGLVLNVKYNGVEKTLPADALVDVRDFGINTESASSVEAHILQKYPGKLEAVPTKTIDEVTSELNAKIADLEAENSELKAKIAELDPSAPETEGKARGRGRK